MGSKKIQRTSLGGMNLSDFDSLFPGASSGMVPIYMGIAGWVADFIMMDYIYDLDFSSNENTAVIINDGTTEAPVWVTRVLQLSDLPDPASIGLGDLNDPIDLTGLANGMIMIYEVD